MIGHVTVAPHGLPARRASIQLVSVQCQEQAKASGVNPLENREDFEQQLLKIQGFFSHTTAVTDVNGNYVIDAAPSGDYYVHAELPGYASVLPTFPVNEMQSCSDNVRNALAAEGHKVTVETGKTVQVDLSLKKGAAVSGVVHYEDGQPTSQVMVLLMMEQSNGKWELYGANPSKFTDDRGAYRFAGLSPGKYTLQVRGAAAPDVPVVGQGMFGGPVGGQNDDLYPTYAGGSTPREKAAIFEVEGEEELNDMNLTLPVYKVFRLSGRLVSEVDGQPVLAGNISLINTKDPKSVQRNVMIERDGSFHLQNVLEGSYTVVANGFVNKLHQEASSSRVENGHKIVTEGPMSHVSVRMELSVNKDVEGLVLRAKESSQMDTSGPCQVEK